MKFFLFPKLLKDRLSVDGFEHHRFVETGRRYRQFAGDSKMTEVLQVVRVIGPLWRSKNVPFFDYDGNFLPVKE